jgi:glycosidase
MMHTAFTLSTRGIPQLYYGEEIGMEGKEDPDNRRDFPGGFPGDKRSAFSAEGRTQTEQRMYEWTREWIRLRQTHSSMRHGRLIDLFYDDHSYVFARQDQSETVIIAINRAAQEKQIPVPAGSIGVKDRSELIALIGTPGIARVMNGQAQLTLPAKTAVAFAVR